MGDSGIKLAITVNNSLAAPIETVPSVTMATANTVAPTVNKCEGVFYFQRQALLKVVESVVGILRC
jgi:hypothetical protein